MLPNDLFPWALFILTICDIPLLLRELADARNCSRHLLDGGFLVQTGLHLDEPVNALDGKEADAAFKRYRRVEEPIIDHDVQLRS